MLALFLALPALTGSAQDLGDSPEVIAITANPGSETTVRLSAGWNMLSVPIWAETITLAAADFEAWLVYENGKWVHHHNEQALKNVLNNPAKAVLIKAVRQTEISFKWAELTPDRQFASQTLSQGWNLISSSLQADFLTILAGIHHDGTRGVTLINAANEHNGRKEAGYHLHWPRQRYSLESSNYDNLADMYPWDGYWVYLQGDNITFSTPIGGNLPAKTD